MSSNAETVARVLIEIDRILRDYLEPSAGHVANPGLTIEHLILEIDSNDAVAAAERVLAGYTGPKLVK